jgi:hypothetical protein|nr:MAG TPA: hypothetical protein [Caudoviricetes sp.]
MRKFSRLEDVHIQKHSLALMLLTQDDAFG